MFCKNCGSQLPDNATICPNCGANMAQNSANTVNTSNVVNAMPNQNVKQFNNKNKKVIGIAVGAVALVVVALILFATKKTTVNLNKYITVSFSGYDTLGRASYDFDTVAFRKDYKDKIKIKAKGKELKELKELEELYSLLSNDDYCDIFLSLCVEGSLDNNKDLTNGDKVEYKWNCNDDFAKEYFKVKLKYSDMKFDVEGLEKAKTIDPFEELDIVYTGISPNGTANIEKNSSDSVVKNLYFSIEPNNNLKNGDTITVKLNNAENDDYYVENYGVILSKKEKEYTVEGLDSYVQSSSEISTDILEKMKKQAEDCFNSQTVSWEDEVKVTNINYIGNYFLKPKFADGYYSYNNCIYLVYRIDTEFNNEYLNESVSFYYYVKFTDIMMLSDGTCSVDLSKYNSASTWDGFSHEYKWGDSWLDATTLHFPGYENLDIMFNKLVTAEVSNYEYENNVKDIE